ncbi:MAG: hypothetical protein J3R72DRAFT_445255 [Linnemannia gamsii]|nr:MAG: hypothetical protein J3R72DRAFT_445255 [Linnemannia gamsii]
MSCPAGYTFSTKPKRAPFEDLSETLEPGQRFQYWDYEGMWTDKHLPSSRLEPLRMIGDPLADDAVEALKVKKGQDALKALREYISRPESEQESQAPALLMKQLMTVPEWVDWEQVRRGQEVYWKYCLYISYTLLHFSLAGGFAIPKITKVLNSTGYLAGDRARERVFETAQFVIDVSKSVKDLQPGTGLGWESIIQVRFLHAGVRARLTKISRAHSKYYNVEEHGVPINQEDLLGTLFSFSAMMWRIMDLRLGVHMKTQEREDFLHLWRYVGHMMGVDDTIGATRTHERADACVESIILHLTDPDPESGRMCSNLLESFAFKPAIPTVIRRAIGFPDTNKIHLAMAEHLLGPKFWKLNGLPNMTLRYKIIKKIFLYFMSLDLWLATKFARWFLIRKNSILKVENLIIRYVLGRKKTQFELKEVPKEGVEVFLEGKVKKGSAALHEVMRYRAEEAAAAAGKGWIWPKALTVASAALGFAMVLRR